MKKDTQFLQLLLFFRQDDDWDAEKSRQYYLDPRFSDPQIANAE
jgi:hypothetical protein